MASRIRGFATSDFARQSAIVFASTLAINALGYGFHFAISRRIGVDAYGTLSALNAGYMISLTVATIFATIVVKFSAELRAVGDLPRLAALSRRLAAFVVAVGTATLVVGLLASPAIGRFLHVRDVRAVAVVVGIVALTIAAGPLRAIFQGMEEFTTFAVLGVIESFVKALAGVLLVYVGFGVTGAFAGWALGTALSLAAVAVALVRRFRSFERVPFNVDVRRLATTTGGVATGMLALTALGYADVIVVKHFVDARTAGLYGALSLSGKILLFFVAFVPTVVLPKATRAALAGRSALPTLLQALGLVIVISVCGLAVYGLAPRLVVTALAGSAFAPAAPYAFSYGVAMVFLAALNVVVSFKIGLHRFDFVVPVVMIALAEIAGISLRHANLGEVIEVLVAGNAAAFFASLYRIGSVAPIVAERSAAA